MAVDDLGTGVPGQPGAGEGNGGVATPGTPADKGVVAGTPGAPADKGFTFKEDRSDWVPRHRLNESGNKLTAAETRAKELEGELDRERQRVRVAMGIDPKDPKVAETEEIRAAIAGMFPELDAIKGFTREQLTRIMEAADSAQATSRSTWERHATEMLGSLEGEVSKAIGAAKLTPTQVKRLHSAYREEASATLVERDAAMRRGERTTMDTQRSDTDFLARHERGDRTLISEFAKAFLADWFEPARRTATAETMRRQRPVPGGDRARVPVTGGAPKVDLSNDAEFKKALIAAREGAT